MTASIVVPVILGLFTSGVAIFLKFYPKWYPDVDQQKRHLKTVLFWLLNLTPYACATWSLTIATKYFPFGKFYVLSVTLILFLLTALFVLQVIRPFVFVRQTDLYDPTVGTYPGLINMFEKAIRVIDSHERMLVIQGKILSVIVDDPKLSQQTREKINTHLAEFEREEQLLKAYRAGEEGKQLA